MTAEMMDRLFAFSSASAHDSDGFGEWRVRAEESGRLSIEHNLLGAVTDFGSFRLSPSENASLWDLIADAALEARGAAHRAAVPHEAMLAFALSAQETLHSVQLWATEAFADEPIARLIENMGNLIEKYTGTTPVLR
ncbi:MAG TPA: hypothetical protein VGJ22_05690 [Anaerolineales bacterium]|jgi:hypothetical protein